jgi:putative transcriptional regulator
MSEAVRSEVRKLRFLNGEMTQEELARQVGVSRQTIVAIEGGMYNPSVGLALRIANVFGVAVEGAFALDEPEGPRGTRGSRRGRGA